ncbi:hypothetical protein PUMCH_004853 [Australozyma saopauloensis]|uniref:Anaphase spindle elongation protein n=1 Tax=Australozyma saopauloensis TaxID=291208 RepID=A0AAX4HHN0_9ASCO|nr:hypothetical protein PUMCH_004853 [[Candida] saopauloensis]
MNDLLHSMNNTSGEVHTPPRSNEYMREVRNSFDESIIQVNSSQTPAAEQFDFVASKVNDTIDEIRSVYKEIGYSQAEVTAKKNEIFASITETIATFTQNLERERTNIQNECDWLRQQIHLIFSILNEDRGERILSLTDRWLLFKDDPQVQQEIAAEKAKSKVNHEHLFLLSQSSRYSLSSLILSSSHSDSSTLSSWKEPSFSLLQTKSRLNSIFLEALKTFVKVFRKFNEANVAFWENIDLIIENWTPDPSDSFLCSLPSKSDAYAHAKLIKEFDDMLEDLNLENRGLDYQTRASENSGEVYAFVISSPSKRISKTGSEQTTQPFKGRCVSIEDEMSRLRDINYNIVRTIRGLKVLKLNRDVLAKLLRAIENTETEIRSRIVHVKEKLTLCLQLTRDLCLDRKDVITILKDPAASKSGLKQFVSNEGQIEVETLHFISENPQELGLKDQHINFISKLVKTLQSIKTAKEDRLATMKSACVRLWDTLKESPEYSQRFLEENDNLRDQSLQSFEAELRRLKEKRREFIEEFISLTQQEIERYHVLLFHTLLQRQEFKYHNLDLYLATDDKEHILSEHEQELERLKKEYLAKLEILELYSELKSLIEDRKFLVESSKNSKRLLEKNSCQTLLNEERIRKKVLRNMPRVLTTIKKKIVDYNTSILSNGGKAFNVGEMDLFEEVLILEAETESQKPSKTSRHRSTKVSLRSVSPSKSRVAARAPSPVKQKQSPQRVTKYSTQRNTLSPIKSDRFKTGSARSTSSLAYSSGIPKLVTREPMPLSSKQSGQKSPSLRSPINFTLHSSPRQAHLYFQSSEAAPLHRRQQSSHLQPLQSPLPPDTSASNELFSDVKESTLYSTCSRLSPLRGGSLSNLRANSPGKKQAIPVSETDKENSLILSKSPVEETYGLSPIRFDGSFKAHDHVSRLSTNSLANSTILGDDYQTWREERIREINENR